MRQSRTVRGAACAIGAIGAVIAGSALAACGHGTSAGGSAGAAGGASGASATQVVTAAYVQTTDSGTAKVSLAGKIDTEVNGKQQSIPISAVGTIDFVGKAADLTETVPGQSTASTETRYLNGMLYQRIPTNSTQLFGGKSWVSLNLSQLTRQQGGSGLQQLLSSAPSDPVDVLTYLRSVDGNVRSVGPDTVDGVPTTHYTATVDLNKVAAANPAGSGATKQLAKELGSSSLPVQLWIDQQNRVRKISVDETIAQPVPGSTSANGATNGAGSPNVGPVHTTIAVTLSDYGTPVHIVPPPANQTDDLTSALTGGN